MARNRSTGGGIHCKTAFLPMRESQRAANTPVCEHQGGIDAHNSYANAQKVCVIIAGQFFC
jgi:hypothetical protein